MFVFVGFRLVLVGFLFGLYSDMTWGLFGLLLALCCLCAGFTLDFMCVRFGFYLASMSGFIFGFRFGL